MKFPHVSTLLMHRQYYVPFQRGRLQETSAFPSLQPLTIVAPGSQIGELGHLKLNIECIKGVRGGVYILERKSSLIGGGASIGVSRIFKLG